MSETDLWVLMQPFVYRIIAVVLVLVIGIWLALLIRSVAIRVMTSRGVDSTVIHFVGSALQVVLYGLVAIEVLRRLGVESTSLIALVGAAGFAVGLALKAQLSNVAAGLIMILFRPFSVGHHIEAAGTEGTVERIELMSTEIRTPENVIVIVPNAKLTSDKIVNYSLQDTRRLNLEVGVNYKADLNKVREVLHTIIENDHRILESPAPDISVKGLEENCVRVEVRAWVKSGDYWKVKVDIAEKIKDRFDAENISFPASPISAK
jgi:small conductance mechanosensitive channel